MTAKHPLQIQPSLRIALVACAVATLLAACSILPARAPVQMWQPPAGADVATADVPTHLSLRVDTPNATTALDQTAILVMPAPGKVSTYKGARWSDAPAVLVRQRLVDAFMAQKLAAVTTDDDHFSTDYSLSGDLRAFQTEYRAGAPVVVVRYDAQLRRGGSRSALATHSFVVTQSPSGAQVPAIVQAFGAADDALAHQVVAWALANMRDQPRGQAAEPVPPRN